MFKMALLCSAALISAGAVGIAAGAEVNLPFGQ
jgi:hypothetical protein